jgi:hypothetical protein
MFLFLLNEWKLKKHVKRSAPDISSNVWWVNKLIFYNKLYFFIEKIEKFHNLLNFSKVLGFLKAYS